MMLLRCIGGGTSILLTEKRTLRVKVRHLRAPTNAESRAPRRTVRALPAAQSRRTQPGARLNSESPALGQTSCPPPIPLIGPANPLMPVFSRGSCHRHSCHFHGAASLRPHVHHFFRWFLRLIRHLRAHGAGNTTRTPHFPPTKSPHAPIPTAGCGPSSSTRRRSARIPNRARRIRSTRGSFKASVVCPMGRFSTNMPASPMSLRIPTFRPSAPATMPRRASCPPRCRLSSTRPC